MGVPRRYTSAMKPSRMLVLLGLLGGSVQTAAAAPEKPTRVVVARLVDWPQEQHRPHCGVVHFVALMEYEVVRVEQGEPIGPRFWVAVSCPELARGSGPDAVRSFTIGDLHRLSLTEKYPATVPKPFVGKNPLRYFWPLGTEKATP